VQEVQVVEPSREVKVPGGQSTHHFDPITEYFPALHIVQEELIRGSTLHPGGEYLHPPEPFGQVPIAQSEQYDTTERNY
jgi:hypothetical protein